LGGCFYFAFSVSKIRKLSKIASNTAVVLALKPELASQSVAGSNCVLIVSCPLRKLATALHRDYSRSKSIADDGNLM
jgi:hypothetical protein